MKNAHIICAIALSLATTFVLTAGGTNSTAIIKCEGVPSMPAASACDKLSGGEKHMAELCAKVLAAAPPNSETTVYASRATEVAGDSYFATYQLIGSLSDNASLPTGDLREAYNACSLRYESATINMGGVTGLLWKCDLEQIAVQSEFVIAFAAIDNCAHNLRQAGVSSSPLYGRVLADRDMTWLAFSLVEMAANKLRRSS